MEFLGIYCAARISKSHSSSRFITYEDFTEILSSKFVPGRFHKYAEKTYIPTAEEYEGASKKLEKELDNQSYFGNYNNLIFM
jgi:hypothetical protein